MTTVRDGFEPQTATKRTMAALSHAAEEIAEAAGADATVVALFQHGAYFAPMRRRYERLAASGATVIVGYSGTAATAGRVHHVSLGTSDPLVAEWSVALITPTTGAFLRGLDLVDFDPSESDLESGRMFEATWGFDRIEAAGQVDRLLASVADRLDPAVVEQVRAAIDEAQRAEVALPERALGTTARILVGRLETTQRELAATRRALAHETDIAISDPLTGLLNREGLERWLGGPESDGLPMPPMGVILIDLDGFKLINDTLGHLVGDELLCRISDALLEATRTGDVAARWGGDEFVVLCPDAADDQLSDIADRLLRAVASVEVEGARVSASAGIKTCSRRPLPLEDADAALYAAKASGGAQASIAP